MKTPLVKSAVLGGLVSLLLSQAAGAQAVIDSAVLAASACAAGDSCVGVYADNLGGAAVANFDLTVNFAATLSLDSVVFNEDAFGGSALVFDGINTQSTTSVEPFLLSFLTGAGDNNPLFLASQGGNPPLQDGNKVELFVLNFANPTGGALDLSSVATSCPQSPEVLVDPNGNLIPCGPAVPEPATTALLALGMLGVLATQGGRLRRRGVSLGR